MKSLTISKCGHIHHDVRNGLLAIRQLARVMPDLASVSVIRHLARIEEALNRCHGERLDKFESDGRR